MMTFMKQVHVFVFLCLSTLSLGAYVPGKHNPSKANSAGRKKTYSAPFKSDQDIHRYMKLTGQELMVWRCRNAIQHHLSWEPLEYIELYCEVVGRMKSIAWIHNGKEVDLSTSDGKYGHVVRPHYANGKYYSRWIDFKLRIFKADQTDAGLYQFRATDVDGKSREQMIYVDLSRAKSRTHRRRKGHKKSRRKMLRRQKSLLNG